MFKNQKSPHFPKFTIKQICVVPIKIRPNKFRMRIFRENLLDFNNYVGFTKEDPSRNLEESFYFMIEENHKKNRSSIIDYKPNKMRY